jgi:predicted metalloprotease with PDZ domain
MVTRFDVREIQIAAKKWATMSKAGITVRYKIFAAYNYGRLDPIGLGCNLCPCQFASFIVAWTRRRATDSISIAISSTDSCVLARIALST